MCTRIEFSSVCCFPSLCLILNVCVSVVKVCFSLLTSCIFIPYLFTLSLSLSLSVTHTHSGPQGTVCIVVTVICCCSAQSLTLDRGDRKSSLHIDQAHTHTHTPLSTTVDRVTDLQHTHILAHPHLLCPYFTYKGKKCIRSALQAWKSYQFTMTLFFSHASSWCALKQVLGNLLNW